MARASSPRRIVPVKNVAPDRLDLRDRPYQPSVAHSPRPTLNALASARIGPGVLNQRQTNACTGFSLAAVVNFLLQRSGRTKDAPVSPFFFYWMARRYDDFPGPTAEDSGSSCRGALKGWYKHGAAAERLFPKQVAPKAKKTAEQDWWQDAARRPLGAYYRVDSRSVTDMHVALNEVGALYVSATAHSGWDEGADLSASKARGWRIPLRKAAPEDGGHAFAIFGYDAHGFLVQNSWGTSWGDHGFATLTYEDWLENAMDCWVVQLGVVTDQHREVATSLSLRTKATPEGLRVSLATDPSLRVREISPFIVDMENNGVLSTTGEFRTSIDDLKALLTIHLPAARKTWGIGNDTVDVAIYAHGGLTGEETAADTAARWIPALYEAGVFPIFLMWETDLWSTLKNRLEDLVTGTPRPAGGFLEEASRWWNERLERLLAAPGSAIWGEMKQNAAQMTDNKQSGVRQLYDLCEATKAFDPTKTRIHLIGHSAGAIAHSHIADALAKLGWRFRTVSFMAPAVTVATFDDLVVPHLKSGTVERYHQFHLTDDAEQKDHTCRPVLGYGRSLLYLVSESFENGVRTPILGMEKYFDAAPKLRAVKDRVQVWAAPSADTRSTTHGGFDDDVVTMRKVVEMIKAP